MKIDLSCPIEVRGYVLSYSEHSMQASVRMYNLTPRRIASFEAVARWHSSEENKSIVCPFSMDTPRAAGETIFQIALDNNRLPTADSLEILFNTVRFQDGDADWQANNGPFAEMQPLPGLESNELTLLRNAAGTDAVCYPRQDSRIWTCVCGRMNLNNADQCVRCHRDHFEALSFTPERVQNSQTAEAIVSPSTLQEGFLRRRSRLMRRTLLMSLAVLAIATLFALGLPVHDVPRSEPASVLSAVAEP